MKFVLGILALLAVSAFAAPQQGTVYYDKSTKVYKLTKGVIDHSGAAWGTFSDEVPQTGWGQLNVATNQAYEDEVQMYAAGYLEGALTHQLIFQSHQNVPTYFLKNATSFSEPVVKYLNDQYVWIQEMIKKYQSDDLPIIDFNNNRFDNGNDEHNAAGPISEKDYWYHVNLIVQQFEGMRAGYKYNHAVGQALTLFDFLVLNGAGDLFDIVPAVDKKARVDYDKIKNKDELLDLLIERNHCTGLIKATADLSDLYVSHSTWFSYTWMLRIFKYYDFAIQHPATKSRIVAFSSYPGAISSIDDFYALDSNLVVLETTNDVLNQSLYSHVKPSSVLAWMRVVLSNRLTSNGKEWTQLFGRYNSGTYNNQWMVIDFNKFTPGTGIKEGTLWILEQIPGFVESADVSSYLSLGYWPSYNIPYFPTVYAKSGYPEFYNKFGDSFSYSVCPRANILRRDQGNVKDMDSMKEIMLYNNWEKDPFSLGDPCNQIVARCDLPSPKKTAPPKPFGGIDSKIVSFSSMKKLLVSINSGPSHETQQPFSWDPTWTSYAHVGQPKTFNFNWLDVQYTKL